MPLDNRKLTPDTEEMLKGMPLDDECWKRSYDIPHQTKVMIYDAKCVGCGFMRLEVGDKILHSLTEAIDHAQMMGEDLIRSCEYPSDVQIINGQEVFPSLTEIIMNTCRFWNKENLEN